MQADLPASHPLRLEEVPEIDGGASKDRASLAWADGEERLPTGLGLAKCAGLPTRLRQ